MTHRHTSRLAFAFLIPLLCAFGIVDARGADPQAPSWIPSLAEPDQGLAVSSVSRQTGLATFASSPGRGILLAVPPNATAEERALRFVDSYGKSFGLSSSAQVRAVRAAESDELGFEHVRLQQVQQGVPVTGGEFVVHMKGSRVLAANGHTLNDLPADVTPRFPAVAAVSLARQMMAKYYPNAAGGVRFSEPRLEIVNRAMLAGIGNDISRLAWFIEATGEELRQFIWIDAQSGIPVLNFSQLAHAKTRSVYNANHNNTLPGTLMRSEGGAATGDSDADKAYDYAGLTYDYFLNNHGRDSFDGAGAELKSTVHYCVPPDSCPAYANAFWNGTQMVYGDGYASADDVVGHELTHAVTERTAGLFYYMQSGALNESFSDIFGETIDLLDGVGNDTTGVRWELGEDLTIGAIRNMMNPNAFQNPSKMTDSTYFVCSTMGWTDNTADHGGVHTNSGVPNHAYALMVDGGTFNGKTVTGIGLTKAAKVEYRALTVYLTSGSSFLDDYNALNRSCTELIGTVGITSGDCAQVKNALEAAEMQLSWGCLGSINPPAKCTAGQVPFSIASEGFETSFGNWVSISSGAGLWQRVNDFAKTGRYSAYGNDPDTSGNSYLQMNNPVVIPLGGMMYFDHLYEFENDINGIVYDGGVLEYSADGVNWFDARPLIDAGANYDGTLAGTGNPLGARLAFTGASYGFTGTRLNLTPLVGQSIRFQFRIGTDTAVSSLGWLIDNVSIYKCASSSFTDDPIIAGVTPVKAIHFTELRSRINALRQLRNLPLFLIALELGRGASARAFDLMERSRSRVWRDRLGLTAPVSLAAVQRALPAGALLLETWSSHAGSAVVLVTRERVEVTRAGLEPALIGRLSDALSRGPGGAWRPLAQQVAGALLPHHLPEGTTSIIVVPDGPLALVPFEILPFEKRMLVESVAVSYVPTAAILLRQTAPRSAASLELRAFASTALKASVDEVRGIARELGGRSVLHIGADNRKEYLYDTRERAPLLHIASHAVADNTAMERSRIAFAPRPGEREPEYLFLKEAYDLPLRGVELAVLSACETERGRMVTGEGVQSFSRALLAAGARSTVTTLWAVPDRSTAAFMKLFYEHLQRGESRAEALRRTKQRFVGRDPHYWAAFVLTGEAATPIPVVPRRHSFALWAGLAAIVIAAAAWAVARKR